jgi:hypothetical protein
MNELLPRFNVPFWLAVVPGFSNKLASCARALLFHANGVDRPIATTALFAVPTQTRKGAKEAVRVVFGLSIAEIDLLF